MLDVRLELENFQPINLESVEESRGKLPENIEEAIYLFNKALEDARFRNEDMAIIALKKAISLHPGFYEAMNFLGICYMAVGKEEMAEFAFKQVIDADDSSIRAFEYLNKMKDSAGESDNLDAVPVKRKNKNTMPTGGTRSYERSKQHGNTKTEPKSGLFAAWLAKGLQKETNSLYPLKYIIGILIGALVTVLVWYMVPTNKSLFTIQRVENILKDEELVNEIGHLNERIEKLEQDLQNRKEENLRLQDEMHDYKNWLSRIGEAESEFVAGNIMTAADLLVDAQGMIPDDLEEQRKALWDKVRLKAAEQLYKDGNSLYSGNSGARDTEVYKQALDKFEAALTYIEQDNVSFLPVLYYQAGKAAARCDELDRAVELFETITADFPASQYSSYASVRLREIDEGKPITGS